MRFGKVILLATVLAGGMLVSGCSSSVDSGDIEDAVQEELTAQTGVEPESVDCPDDLDADVGETTRCNITASDGTEIGVTVTVTEVDGSDVNFEFQVDEEPAS